MTILSERTECWSSSRNCWVLDKSSYLYNSFKKKFIIKQVNNIGRQFWNSSLALFYELEKHNFELWVDGDGLEMYTQIQSGFGYMRAILPRSKKWVKTGNFKESDSLVIDTIRFVSTSWSLINLMWSDVWIG